METILNNLVTHPGLVFLGCLGLLVHGLSCYAFFSLLTLKAATWFRSRVSNSS